jgi:predicted transcriptional regulator
MINYFEIFHKIHSAKLSIEKYVKGTLINPNISTLKESLFIQSSVTLVRRHILHHSFRSKNLEALVTTQGERASYSSPQATGMRAW